MCWVYKRFVLSEQARRHACVAFLRDGEVDAGPPSGSHRLISYSSMALPQFGRSASLV